MSKILVLIIVPLILGAVAYGGLTIYKQFGLPAEINAIATQFFQSLSNGNFDNAFSHMSSEFHEKPPEGLPELKENLSLLFDQYEFQAVEQTGFEFSLGQEESTYTYEGYITYADGSIGDMFLILVKEGGKWRIRNFEVSTPY